MIKSFSMVNREIFDREPSLSGKVDILKYEILYNFGGVYIDADCKWINDKSLTPLLERVNEKGLFACREDHRLIGNSVIGSVPGNPLLSFVINTISETYHELHEGKKWESWVATGPSLFTECIKPINATIFPIHYFYPLSWHYDSLWLLHEQAL